MTFIQPKKGNGILNKILLLLAAGLVLGAFWMVILYNGFVNFNHGLSGLRLEFQQVQAQNSELKDKIFHLFDSVKANNANGAQLIQDKNPEYLEVNSKWSYASGY